MACSVWFSSLWVWASWLCGRFIPLPSSHHPDHINITTCYGIGRDLLFDVLLYCSRKYSKNMQGIKEASLLAESVNREGFDRKNEDVLSFLSFHPCKIGVPSRTPSLKQWEVNGVHPNFPHPQFFILIPICSDFLQSLNLHKTRSE